MSEEKAALERRIVELKTQLTDIGALATEYRSTANRLENELKNFKRREPLVQLLWTEIQQLRGALNVAISSGFAYDLSDPGSRYVKPSHFAYIDRLDVSRWAPIDRREESTTQGGTGKSRSRKNKHRLSTPSQVNEEDEDSSSSDREESSSIPPPPPAEPVKHKDGMRSGDDAAAMQSTLDVGFASPLGGPVAGTINYDLPVAPSPEPILLAAAASAASSSVPTAPGAPSITSAPSTSAPSAPSAPGAPPMAPSAPGAPPMAPGIPVPPMAGPPLGLAARPVNQPTKPVVKPLRKMKALHWTRILLPAGSDQSIWTTVSQTLPKLESKVSYQELDALFADVKKEKKDGAESSSSSTEPRSPETKSPLASPRGGSAEPSSPRGGAVVPKNMRFLSDKRFNAVAIMLSFLPATEKVIEGVQKLDEKILDKDQVSALQKQMPTEEELSTIVSSGVPLSDLAKPEAFLAALSQAVPCVGSRVDCWHFMNGFKEMVEDLRTPFQIISTAIAAVRQSKCLPVICAIVLHAGNYINGGTPRGQADGFDLSVFGRLGMIKDVQGNTMLAFVVNKLLDIEGEQFGANFVSELSACRGASEFPLRPALAAATRFQSLIKTQKNLCALVIAGTDDPSDPFTKIAQEFGKESEAVGQELKASGQQCNDAFNQLLFYLNPSMDASTAAKTQSEDLFQILLEFAENVKTATEQRAAQKEAAAAQKKQQEIRERQQLARSKQIAEKAEKEAAAAAASPKK